MPGPVRHLEFEFRFPEIGPDAIVFVGVGVVDTVGVRLGEGVIVGDGENPTVGDGVIVDVAVGTKLVGVTRSILIRLDGCSVPTT